MMKLRVYDSTDNSPLTFDGTPVALAASLQSTDAGEDRVIYREWLYDSVTHGTVREVYEHRLYAPTPEILKPNVKITRQHYWKACFVYWFEDEANAMAFRLSFHESLFIEPDPSIALRSEHIGKY